MKLDSVILKQWSAYYNSSQTKVYQKCFIDRCMRASWKVDEENKQRGTYMLYFKLEANQISVVVEL